MKTSEENQRVLWLNIMSKTTKMNMQVRIAEHIKPFSKQNSNYEI